MKLIRLKLQAPLQSWGERSRWDSRDTAAMPTKSAIIGLLGCCLGLERGSEQLTALDAQVHMAVRADKPGSIITDFHTVQSPKGTKLLNAEGKPRGDTILTPKQYLQDASFTVLLWGDPAVLERCVAALNHPKWTPYLGRRSCVPSVPLIPEWLEADTVDQALRMDAAQNAAVEVERLPGESLRADEHLVRRADGVVDAAKNQYYSREVRASYVLAEV